MNPKEMYDLKEMLCTELRTYARKGGISRTDLEPIERITNSIANLVKITEAEEGGYSYGEGSWTPREPMGYSGRNSYGRGSRDYSPNNGYSNEGYDTENRMKREMMMY